MLLVTAKIENFDQFLEVFSTLGADKRKQHGSKGSTIFRDPTDPNRLSVYFDWDAKGWQSFVADPEVPSIFKKAGLVTAPQAAELVASYKA